MTPTLASPHAHASSGQCLLSLTLQAVEEARLQAVEEARLLAVEEARDLLTSTPSKPFCTVRFTVAGPGRAGKSCFVNAMTQGIISVYALHTLSAIMCNTDALPSHRTFHQHREHLWCGDQRRHISRRQELA